MAVVEITIRTFFTCDEAQIAPQTKVMVDSENLSKLYPALVEGLFNRTCALLNGGPFTNLREMTSSEVELHLAAAEQGES